MSVIKFRVFSVSAAKNIKIIPQTTVSIIMDCPTIANQILSFYQSLTPPDGLQKNVEVMNPYLLPSSWKIVEQFYHKYYEDKEKRIALFGINPGRFGGGVTGIPFTDPIRLQELCGIDHSFEKRTELSSTFIYEMINAMGGPMVFYRQFYFTATSPLGFISNGKNLNYYDIPGWKEIFSEYATTTIRQQLAFIDPNLAICIGQGKNFEFLNELNNQHHFFEEIRSVPHPRWVMQYRLKRKQEFIDVYKKQMMKS